MLIGDLGKCPGPIVQIPATKSFENAHPWAEFGPSLGQAWARLGPGLGLGWPGPGPIRQGPIQLDTSEGSGHFLDKNLAFSLAHPHILSPKRQNMSLENVWRIFPLNLDPVDILSRKDFYSG